MLTGYVCRNVPVVRLLCRELAAADQKVVRTGAMIVDVGQSIRESVSPVVALLLLSLS